MSNKKYRMKHRFGIHGRKEKTKLLILLLKRRFNREEEVDYLLKFVDEQHIDDMLRELLIWDEISRRT